MNQALNIDLTSESEKDFDEGLATRKLVMGAKLAVKAFASTTEAEVTIIS
jgi:hypothetical protein